MFHHIGAFFCFAAFILLLLVSLSVPIIHSIRFLTANFSSGSLYLGNWGYCIKQAGGYSCSGRQLGYDIIAPLGSVAGNTGNYSNVIRHGLTYALVLHPIAAGFAFAAFLLAVCATIVTHILGSIAAFFAFLISLIALAIDLGLFIYTRNHINDQSTGHPASLSNAIWMMVGATVALLIASLTICCGGLRDRRTRRSRAYDAPVAAPVASDGVDNGAYMNEKRAPWWRRRRTAVV